MAAAASSPHVLIIVQNLPVPLDRRVWSECRELVGAGYRVSVICPKGEGNCSAAFEELEGVRIHRYAPPAPATGLLSYGWEFAYCWARTAVLALRIFRRERFDVIQACNPPDTYFALAKLFGPFGVRFVFDHHDLCPELYMTRDPGNAPDARVLRALELLERGTYRMADHVITTNETYLQRARSRTGKPAEAFTIVRSSPDPEAMRPREPQPELRHGREHLVCYIGIMGLQDGVENVVRAAAHVKHALGRTDIQFVLMGFGDTLDRLRALTSELDVDDIVRFTGRVELPTLTAYLSTADVGVCPDPKTAFNDASTMNKVLEYMAHALPCVSYDLSETQRFAGPAAHYVPWTGAVDADQRAFGDAIVEMLADDARRAEMGREGRHRIESGLGWPAQAAAYVGAYDRLMGIERALPPVQDLICVQPVTREGHAA